jgi:hypothetical protein
MLFAIEFIKPNILRCRRASPKTLAQSTGKATS